MDDYSKQSVLSAAAWVCGTSVRTRRTLKSIFVAKLYLQVNSEEVNRESWESVLNYTETLSCNCLSGICRVSL